MALLYVVQRIYGSVVQTVLNIGIGKSLDLVNLQFWFLVQSRQCWICFDSFDLILFMPEEGKPETSCSNKPEIESFRLSFND